MPHHLGAEVGIVDFAPVNLREDHKAAGIGLDHLLDDGLEFVAPHAGKDHDGFHVGGVHDLNHLLGRHVVVDAGGVVDVVVDVDDVELGPIDWMDGDVQHGDRLEVAEEQSLLLIGVGGGFEAGLGRGRVLGDRERTNQNKEECGQMLFHRESRLSKTFLLFTNQDLRVASGVPTGRGFSIGSKKSSGLPASHGNAGSFNCVRLAPHFAQDDSEYVGRQWYVSYCRPPLAGRLA